MTTVYRRGTFTISTDQSILDISFIHEFLSYQSYWAKGRTREVVEESIKNSICFGVFDDQQQVGFARLVTDYVTFAWLCDVFIADSHRGLGLGKWLIESIVGHSKLQGVKRILLATSDAHDLYRKYGGFDSLQVLSKWMERISPESAYSVNGTGDH